MRILFIGDIFGNTGRRVLAERLPSIIKEKSIDVCIGNGENAAGGRGLTGNLFKKLRKYGVNIVTGGNHSFSIPDSDIGFMENECVLRPLNFPPGNIGRGTTVIGLGDGRKIGVINLQGRTFMHEALDCPFRTGKAAVEETRRETQVILIDFHAEATSEKLALASYLDGMVSAVVGTHTHVQTSDERILQGGTAYISDVGMTGPEDSVIGMKKKQVIRRFLLQTPVRFEQSESGPMLNGVVIEVDESSGKALSIERVYERVTFRHE
ncbi:MAG: TIGR00282 family metallophosphoesterase [Fibrobacter sp.]|jgi:metallophosphoesterase (TIGR00282 family)|nr:TIGR00282 family metallophosphoesterase [Fibrobacter sp.]